MKILIISLVWMLYVKGEVQIIVTYGREPSHQCLHDNDDVTLTCTVNPVENIVEWLNETTNIGRCNTNGFCVHDGDIDTIKYTFSFSSPGEFRLRKNPISPGTDAGVYKCEHEGVSASVTLDACVQVASAQLQKVDGTTINGGSLEVDVNKPTTLTCKVLPTSSKPAPTIVWYIGSVKKTESTHITYQFTPSETHNNKMIYCAAYNLQPASEAVNSTKPLLLVRVPVSTVQLKKDNQAFNSATLTATASDTVNLSCTPGFSRPSSPTIDWYIGTDKKLTDNVQYRYTAEANDHNEMIYCQAYLPWQTEKADSNKPRLNVNVLVTSVILKYQGNPPSSSDRVTVTAGIAATFTCTTSLSRPQAKIDWYIKSIQDNPGTLKQNSTSTTYDFIATNADHNKRIYCKAYNEIQTEAQGILSEEPMLYVQVKVTTVLLRYPGNTPSTGDTVTVTAGRAARFTCTTSFSRPVATIDWYIEGDNTPKQRSTSPTYDLNATDADHNRRIYCKAYINIQTEAQGILSQTPKLYVQVQVSAVTLKHNNQQLVTGGQLVVTAGSPERLTCEPGYCRPTPTIDWYIKDDTNRKHGSTVYTYDLDAKNEDHDKVIYCKAYNLQEASNGVVSTKPKLYVRVKVTTVLLRYPGNTPSTGDTVTVTAGRAARFTCTTSFSRPVATIDWYIEGDNTPKQRSTSPTYDLNATDADHNRRIYCKAYINIQTEAQGILSQTPKLYVQVQVSAVTLKHNNQQLVTGGQLVVTAGSPERLTCEPGYSRPTPTIDWYIKDDTNRKHGSTVYTYDLDAKNEDHDKVIYCKAYNLQEASNGVVSTKPKLYVRVKVTTVTLKYPGNTPSTGDTVTVTAGRAARFTCTTSFSRPVATIDWYIEGDNTPKQRSTSPTYDLNATDADHNRRIYCKAYINIQTEAQGILSQTPKLYVQVQVSAVTLKHNNQQLVTGGQLVVTAGSPERLTCEPGYSRPTPTIDWYIEDDTNRKHGSTVYTYDLDAKNEDHDKVIYCKAYNLQEASNGVVSTKPKLYVRVVAAIPSFLNSSTNGFTLLNGDNYTIQCQSTPTRPAAIVTWKIKNNDLTNTNTREVPGNGGLVSVISTLSLYAQTSYHESEIICESKISGQTDTPETKTTVIIWWRPSKPLVETFSGDFPWAEGGQGQLTCSSADYGNPSAKIIWTGKIGTMNAEKRLVIDSLSYLDHKRAVKCRMENSFTNEKDEIVESHEISLNVQFSPKFLTTDAVFVGKIQENVSITFPIYSNPEEVIPKLFVNGSEINNNEKYVVNKDGVSEKFNLSITIVDLEEGDFAIYLLNVNNDIGTTKVNFTVTAESIPSVPTSFGLRELRGSVAIFYWERGFNGGHKQHFMLQLKGDTEDTWSNRTIVEEHDMNSNLGNTSYIANISGLNPGTYRARLIAVNSIGAADPVLLETTFTIPTQETTSSNQGGAIAGGVTAGVLVIIVILASVFILRRLRRKGLIMIKKNKSLQQQEHDYYNMPSKETGKSFHTKGSSPTTQCSETAKYEDLTQIRGNSSAYDNIGASRNEESTYEGLQPGMSKAQVYDTLNQDNKTNTDSEIIAPIYTNLTLN